MGRICIYANAQGVCLNCHIKLVVKTTSERHNSCRRRDALGDGKRLLSVASRNNYQFLQLGFYLEICETKPFYLLCSLKISGEDI